jgi:hypothetical protein
MSRRRSPTAASRRRDNLWWSSDFQKCPLGVAQSPGGVANSVAAALEREWSWFGQPGQEDLFGFPEVVSAAAEGLPPAPGGDHVLKLDHQIGDPAYGHKLFKTFDGHNWTNGDEPVQNDGRPADAVASARYIAYQYVPSNRFSMTSNGWVNMFQWKESIDRDIGWVQNPYWFMGVRSGGPYAPLTLSMSNWDNTHPSVEYDFTPWFDKWVKWEGRMYQGDRLEWYLDGQLMDVGYANTYQTGPLCVLGGTYEGGTITHCQGWVFGCGNYGSSASLSGPAHNEPDYNYMDNLMYVSYSAILPLSPHS